MSNINHHVLHADIAWLTLLDFAEVSGLTPDQVRELVDLGILSPLGAGVRDWRFSLHAMSIARQLKRLREDLDLDLDLHALALGFRLLERISELEIQLCRERACRIPE